MRKNGFPGGEGIFIVRWHHYLTSLRAGKDRRCENDLTGFGRCTARRRAPFTDEDLSAMTGRSNGIIRCRSIRLSWTIYQGLVRAAVSFATQEWSGECLSSFRKLEDFEHGWKCTGVQIEERTEKSSRCTFDFLSDCRSADVVAACLNGS